MRGYLLSSAVLAGSILAVAGPARATVLINSNFNAATLGAVANNGAVDQFTATVSTNTAVTVVDLGAGDQAVTLTDNVTPGTANVWLRKSVSGLSTDSTGENHVTGSFEYTRLAVGSGTESSFRFLLNRAGQTNLSDTNTLVSIRIDRDEVKYSAGFGALQVGLSKTLFSPAIGTTYIFEIDVDLSSDVQDTWFFRVKNAGGTLLYTSDTFNTPIANGLPGEVLFQGGFNGSPASSDPFVRMDDVQFEAAPIPEPASMALLGLGGLMMAFRGPKRGRRD